MLRCRLRNPANTAFLCDEKRYVMICDVYIWK